MKDRYDLYMEERQSVYDTIRAGDMDDQETRKMRRRIEHLLRTDHIALLDVAVEMVVKGKLRIDDLC